MTKAYRKYIDKDEIEEISLDKALWKLRQNYPGASDEELTSMLLQGTLNIPGAIYSLKKENILSCY